MTRAGTGEYPPNWKWIARIVKLDAGLRCVRCGRDHDPISGYCLTVHHLDLNRSNCEWWNLAALCQRCHLHIQSKVVMERPWLFEHSEWFKPYVAGYYAHWLGLRADYDYVIENMDEIFAQADNRIAR